MKALWVTLLAFYRLFGLAANSSLTSQVYCLKPVEINNELIGVKSQIFVHVSISKSAMTAELIKPALCCTSW